MRLDGEAWEQPLPQEDEQPLNVGFHAVTCVAASMHQHAILSDIQPDSYVNFGSPRVCQGLVPDTCSAAVFCLAASQRQGQGCFTGPA